ncbi:MAG: class I SAM-dependent methyltransferase [Gammaproteobacteria bacterium]|nr:class I SAM-dependent methyltransferase [Gammaproteobacteria bacterium]
MTFKSNHTFNYPSHTWRQIEKWYQSEIGQEIFQSEVPVVEELLDQCFGYNLVLMGAKVNARVLDKSRIKQKCCINPLADQLSQPVSSILYVSSLFEMLSLKSGSIDAIVLFHCLEFSPDPHAILREAERVLVAEGKLIIAGFNPFSLFGLWRYSLRIKAKYQNYVPIIPSKTPLISTAKIQDWLSLLGFSYQDKESIFFRPPINNHSLLLKIQFMEKTGKRFWPFLSSAYVMMAVKRVSTLTPIKNKWRLKKKLVGEVVSETSVTNLNSISNKDNNER